MAKRILSVAFNACHQHRACCFDLYWMNLWDPSSHAVKIVNQVLNKIDIRQARSYGTYCAYRNEQLWVSDITCLRTENGFVYLSLITDAYSRKIIGYRVSQHLKAQGCIIALNKAIGSYRITKKTGSWYIIQTEESSIAADLM